jgi:hypothetical protein
MTMMKTFKDYLTPASILVLAGVLLFNHVTAHPAPSPSPAVNGVALGRSFAPVLASTYADGWLAAAKVLEDGRPVADAQKALQDTWKEGRTKAFLADVVPGFSVVLPEGAEPSSPERRAQVVELWRSFAKGLKGGH